METRNSGICDANADLSKPFSAAPYFMVASCMTADGKLNHDAQKAATRLVCKAGAQHIITRSATGQAARTTGKEALNIFLTTRQEAPSDVHVYGTIQTDAPDEINWLADSLMQAGAAGMMLVPPTGAYDSTAGFVPAVQELADRPLVNGAIMAYCKDGAALTDAGCVELVRTGSIRMIKRATPNSLAFLKTREEVKAVNPDFPVNNGAAERQLYQVAPWCEGFTTGFGTVFPNVAMEVAKAYYEGNFSLLADLLKPCFAIEKKRAGNDTGNNPAPVHVLLKELYGIDAGMPRTWFARFKEEDRAECIVASKDAWAREQHLSQ